MTSVDEEQKPTAKFHADDVWSILNILIGLFQINSVVPPNPHMKSANGK